VDETDCPKAEAAEDPGDEKDLALIAILKDTPLFAASDMLFIDMASACANNSSSVASSSTEGVSVPRSALLEICNNDINKNVINMP
jgi:hypothetical protein